ncbi:MAG: NUDIX hydrolase, partial [Candidatus Sungiibacteriota bacterium]
VKEECGLDLSQGCILIKEKAIGRPDGQTSKSLSFLCTAKDPHAVIMDENDFTDYRWVNLDELRTLLHVGIEAEFIKVMQIADASNDKKSYFCDTDKVDFRR